MKLWFSYQKKKKCQLVTFLRIRPWLMLVREDRFVDPMLETATLISSGDGITPDSSLILFISDDMRF